MLDNNVSNDEEFKCHCEHENGRGEKNGILCGFSGAVEKVAKCRNNEWCTGPFLINESVQGTDHGRDHLCVKGKVVYFLPLNAPFKW